MTFSNMTLDSDLLHSFEQLTDTQKQLLQRIINSFHGGVRVTVNPDSDLCKDPRFSDYFANLFSVYHSITEHKFEKKSFEFAFKYASIASGFDSNINKNSSHQGEDVTRENERISLKTEGESTDTTFKISKFSEARFIANYKTEIEESEINKLPNSEASKKTRLEELLKRRSQKLLPRLVSEFQNTVRQHLKHYDRIICLKTAANEEDGFVRSYHYRLIEIPIALIEKSLELKPDEFKPLRGNGGTSASVRINGEKVFGVTLDGSVEKISITGINISKCITHAEFIVPVTI